MKTHNAHSNDIKSTNVHKFENTKRLVFFFCDISQLF